MYRLVTQPCAQTPTSENSPPYRDREIGDLYPSHIRQIPLENSSYWKVLETREVANCQPYMTLLQQSIMLPNRQVIDDYHRLEMPDHVVVYARVKGGMVAALKQYKHGYGAETLTLPGGMVEAGEDPFHAAIRELREETGLTSSRWYPLGSFCVNGNYGAGYGHYFLADECHLREPKNSDDLEEAKILWLDSQQLQHMLNHGKIPLMHHALAIALVRSFEHDP